MTADTASPSQTELAPASWKALFFAIWAGQALSLLGSQLVQFALIWYLTQKTNSATTLATASLVGLLPQVFLQPIIGTLVDRWNRRRIMIAADVCIALATAGLAVLFAVDAAQVWHIYLLMFLRSVGGGFHQSAMGASVVLLVPKEHLARVQGMNQALQGGMNVFSAPLGALLLSILPMQGVLAVDVTTAALAVIPLLFIAIPQPQRSVPVGKSSFAQDMHAGVRYVWAWPGLMIILMMAAAINFLLTPVHSLMPLLVTRHFGGGALQLGWLEAITGAGVILGGLALGAWGGFRRRIVTAMVGLMGIGAGVVMAGAASPDAFWLALAGVLLAGLMMPITNGSLGAILQAAIAPEMQGRVFGLVTMLAGAVSPVGLMLAGPAADALGIRVWYWAGGIVCAGMGVVGFLIPAVMHIEK